MLSKKNSILWVGLVFVEFFLALFFAYQISMNMGLKGIALPGLLGQSDSFFYFNQISGNFLRAFDENKTDTWFVPLMTFIATVIGQVNVFIFKFAGLISFLITLVLIVKTIYIANSDTELDLDKVCAKVMLRIAIFPSALIAIVVPLGRDVWIYLGFMLSIYFGSKIAVRSANITDYILAMLSVYFLYGFRGYAAVSVVLGWLLFYMMGRVSRKQVMINVMVICSVLVIWFTLFSSLKLPFLNLSLKDALLFQSGYVLNNAGEIVAQNNGGSDFMGAFNSSNIIVFVFQLLVSYAGNLVGPFVWQVKSPASLGVFVFESLPMLYVLANVFKNRQMFKVFLKSNKVASMLIFQSVTWWTMLALSNNNIGTGMRLKIPLYIFIWIVYYLFSEYKNGSPKGEGL